MKVNPFFYYSKRSDKVMNTVPRNIKIYYIREKARDRLIFLFHSVRLSDNMSIPGPFTLNNRTLRHLGSRISKIQSDPERNLGNKTCSSPFSLICYNLIFSQNVFLTL